MTVNKYSKQKSPKKPNMGKKAGSKSGKSKKAGK